MEAFGEYRAGRDSSGIEQWIECRGEIVAVAESQPGKQTPGNIRQYASDKTVKVVSAIPSWTFEATYPSVGHCLVELARSHRRFVEPNAVKRLWRGMALWPAWGKVAAVVVGLAAVSEILSYVAPHGGTRLVGWIGGLVSGA